MISVLFCCALFLLSIELTALSFIEHPKNGILLLSAMILETGGLLRHIYQRGTYEFTAWNIISKVYHYGEPYSIPDFHSAFLKAINTHDLAFAFPASKSDLFLIFCQATNAWKTASLINSLAILILYLSMGVIKYLARFKRFFLIILLIAPVSIAGWMAFTLTHDSVRFLGYSVQIPITSYMIYVYPFMYHALNKQIRQPRNQS